MVRFRKQKGAALYMVILSFVIIMIFTSSIIALTNQNLKETINQNNRVKAYYIALAGIELGESALMRQVKSDLYIKQFLVNDKKVAFHPSATTMMNFEDGKIRISLKTVTDLNKKKWIEIKSEALVESINQEYVLYKRIATDNFSNTVFDKKALPTASP